MIGIFYGSTYGNTEMSARKIKDALGDAAEGPFDIGSTSLDALSKYSHLILGASTWHAGDLQDDWDAVFPQLKGVDWSNRHIALFGCGDQNVYYETFQCAIGILHDLVTEAGAKVYGFTSAKGYAVGGSSRALKGDQFCGLALDEDNEADKSDDRIAAWLRTLKKEAFVRA